MAMKTGDLSPQAAPRLLVVEDNALIAMDLEEILKSYGCQVVGPSVSVREALSKLDDEDIDVAVVDYQLADGTAASLTKVLDERGIPYAICTGTSEDTISSLYPNTPILGKPYNSEDVSMVVNSLIAARLASV